MNHSEVESNRFNMSIFRLKSEEFDISGLKRDILYNKVDILILRVPSSTKDKHHMLNSLGFPFIHADSLVYYQVPLDAISVQDLRNNLEFEIVDDSNVHEIKEMIPVIFKGYQNHYYSSPFFEHSRINEGYIEWGTSFYGEPGKVSWLTKKNEMTIGFATCSFDETTGDCEGVLYGVLPKHAGLGVYSDIIRFTQAYFKARNFKRMWVSTQIQNYSVQKVWLREGFFLKKTYETYHINCFLSDRRLSNKHFELLIPIASIDAFGSFSGDYNPIHFDAGVALQCGFKGRIAHGVITQAFLSRIFGTEYPGPGTVILNNLNSYLAPVYPDTNYTVVIDTYYVNMEKRIFYVLAKVSDNQGAILFLSYNTLLNRNYGS